MARESGADTYPQGNCWLDNGGETMFYMSWQTVEPANIPSLVQRYYTPTKSTHQSKGSNTEISQSRIASGVYRELVPYFIWISASKIVLVDDLGELSYVTSGSVYNIR
ncbi:6277_t:CDS:2 [Acaulospora colombiana]|uniref:6277_t:CDS:1 n=1 Tax=Acaulospora colombiana TaxID=27376 RepID=A0ACA9L410_9GLOM|nr:6277_t:CDS:2 [Acaulospora colombiana]